MGKGKPVKVLAIVGPTAVGKTEIAIRLARDLGGEIVNADSRQVYRGLDIGTAKPTPEEQAAAKHHLIDFLDPDEWLNVAMFQEEAFKTIADIHRRGKLPILAGGTGQYVQAVIEGWSIPRVEPAHGLRLQLESFADSYGTYHLHRKLQGVDTEAGRGIDHTNTRRVVRALEVYYKSGKPISEHQLKDAPDMEFLIIGLNRSRESLYERVEFRVAIMLQNNWISETSLLIQQYPASELPSLNSLGYPEIARYLRQEMTYDELVEKILVETHRFIRQQYNWFSPDNDQIQWFDLDQESYEAVLSRVVNWVEQGDDQVRGD